jgi:signal transduction histidine kinase
MKFAGANPLGHFGYWAAASIIVVMGWTLYDATTTTRDEALRVDRTLEALEDVSRINEAVSRADAAQRGYAITADDFYLVGRDRAMSAAQQHAESLARRFADDPQQASRIAGLESLLADRNALNVDLETVRRTGGIDALRERMTAGARQSPTGRIYGVSETVRRHELRSLDARRAELRDAYQRTFVILAAGGFVLVAVMIPGYIAFVREAQARHRAERRLVDITENLPGAVLQCRVLADGRMRYEYLGGGAEALRGVRREDALRDPEVLFSTLVEGDAKALLDRVRHCCEDLQPFEHECRVKDPAGIRWLRVMAAPRREPDGSTLLNAHWGDVTEQRRMAHALREAKDAADEANRARSTFLAAMSHEIRTPMNGVIGMLELLALTRLDGEQRTTLEIVRQSGRSLLRSVDEILDFSRIEAGKLELRPEPASVTDIVERVCGIYLGNASGKGLLLTRYADSRIAPAVMVDALRLQQILGNFVSNAIKFTERGEVTLRAQLVERRDGEDVVRFSVEDSGIGVSHEDQRKLFRPFAQAGGEAAQRYGGVGLGLSICQRLATLMGGTLAMQSEPGKGTTMSLALALPIAVPGALRDGPRTPFHVPAIAPIDHAVLAARPSAP